MTYSPPSATINYEQDTIAELYKTHLRYDHKRKRWLVWREHWWSLEEGGEVYRMAKKAIRHRRILAAEFGDKQQVKEFAWVNKSESRPRLEAMIKLAESEKPIADNGEDWDSDPSLLGVANGVVDLRTGSLRAGKRSDKITRHIAVEFDPEAKCSTWEKFLNEIFGGDEEIINFLQRAIGYSITGETNEQVVFFLYGTGANGKSTFIEVLRSAFGDYAYNLPFSAFELKASNNIRNDIAALEGRRFVTASEANESVQLNEALIKSLTGSDSITARFLFKEFFTFEPKGKFWFALNHLPNVSDDSPGFWRRVRVIPFERQFMGENADPQLLQKLKAEAKGILAWAVRGATEWYEKRLQTPEKILSASRTYQKESDRIAEFIEERCVVGNNEHCTARALFDSYVQWAEANHEQRLTRQKFSQRMQAKGYTRTQKGHDKVWTWFGLKLRPPDILS